MKQNLITVV